METLRKRLFFSFVVLLFTYSVQSQVGIGTTTPDSSAILDITSSDKGVLISRVSLLNLYDVVTIPSPAEGLLIYNIATNGLAPNRVFPGYYYYDSRKWVAISHNVGTNINVQTSDYILSELDSKGVVIMDSPINVVVTIPTNLEKGFFCQIIQKGIGQVTLVGASGFTLNSPNGFKTRVRYSSVGVLLETNTLGYVSGDCTF